MTSTFTPATPQPGVTVDPLSGQSGHLGQYGQQTSDKIVSDMTRYVILIVNYCFIITAINVVGFVANIINIVVFVKQGFADRMNISLMGLAISDLGSLLTLQWISVCFTPVFYNSPSLPFDPLEVQYLTGGWPHVCFARITGLITAYISAERCLCIAAPLKVKTILTHRRTIAVMVFIFVLMIGSIVPTYTVTFLGPKFYPGDPPLRNRSRVGLIFAENQKEVEAVTFAFSNLYGYVAFISVLTFTVILVSKLRANAKWRQQNVIAKSTTAEEKGDSHALRDARVIKMVAAISIIFIVCFIPTTIGVIASIVEPEYSFVGQYSNLYVVIGSFHFALESVNSSVNLFIYLKMSSKFRATFDEMTSGLKLPRRKA